jgi:mono/diheme cytochrome c family protein
LEAQMVMSFRMSRLLLTTGLTLVAGMATSRSAAAQDAAQVKRGQEVYAAQKCQVCHAIAGKGAKANPLDGVGKKLTPDETRQWITQPIEMAKKANSTKKPPMQDKYGSLPAADIDALVAYMQSLK